MAPFTRKTILYIMVFSMLSAAMAPMVSAAKTELVIDNETKAGAMAADILLVRPVGIAATVLGTVLFVVALPFAALGGNVPEVFDHLMAKPAKFTFVRPLGDFD